MKRLLSLLLSLMLVIGILASAGVYASAADNMLTVTLYDGSSVSVPVGKEILLTTHLDAGPSKLVNCQAYIAYDSNCLSVVPYGTVSSTGKINITKYSFPLVTGGSIASNLDRTDGVYYNFSSADGIVALTGKNTMLSRFRFKATAPGKTTIGTVIEYMLNDDDVRVYYDSVPDPDLNPVLWDTIEVSEFVHGDADADYEVSIRDITTIQKICAGMDISYDVDAADANDDGTVTLRDAVALRKYLAGSLTDTKIATSYYASEG